jgi:hypothetical protein
MNDKVERAKRKRLLVLRATLGCYIRATWVLKEDKLCPENTRAIDCSLVGVWELQQWVAWCLHYSHRLACLFKKHEKAYHQIAVPEFPRVHSIPTLQPSSPLNNAPAIGSPNKSSRNRRRSPSVSDRNINHTWILRHNSYARHSSRRVTDTCVRGVRLCLRRRRIPSSHFR